MQLSQKSVFGPWPFYRGALAIAVPIMLQQLIQSLVSLIDNFMVSGLGDICMSGVNVAGQMLFVFMVYINAICMAGGIFMTQFFGAKDPEGMRQAFRFKLITGLAAFIPYLLVCVVFPRQVLSLMLIGNTQADLILDEAVKYIRIMFFIGVFMGFFAGPIADKFKIIKLPVACSALFLALGALALYLSHDMTGVTIYAFCAGIGMGLWNSLDNYLNLQVIPDKARVGFFLGVYNVGNSLPQAIGPVIAAAAIGIIGFSGVFVVSMVFALIASFCIFSIRGVAR